MNMRHYSGALGEAVNFTNKLIAVYQSIRKSVSMVKKQLDLKTFQTKFDQLVREIGIDWTAVGFLGANDLVYQFGTDTKVISTVFETQAAPVIHQIADEFGYTVEGAPQTIYPDFSLSLESSNRGRIAIDIKTTYRSLTSGKKIKPFRYTLGSYTSFLRNGTKNILYPYEQYSSHWVIGFLYTRMDGVASKVYRRDESAGLRAPYKDVEYFVQEKYKIVGTTPGSGNTANIGSFQTNDIDDLRNGNGPFSKLGKDVCDEYWRHYGRTVDRPYSDLEGFLRWKKK
jgi:hypothetical protein